MTGEDLHTPIRTQSPLPSALGAAMQHQTVAQGGEFASKHAALHSSDQLQTGETMTEDDALASSHPEQQQQQQQQPHASPDERSHLDTGSH
ncbi:hypothetical protein H4S06_005169 [Coemansia sp. BCRC 34490]|nr:hypothetical protein H4S06_005169 [Coemansia sp. BCRC 34490]